MFLGIVCALRTLASLGTGEDGDDAYLAAEAALRERAEAFWQSIVPEFLVWRPTEISTTVTGSVEDPVVREQLELLRRRGIQPLRVGNLPCSFVNKAPAFSPPPAGAIPYLDSEDEYFRYMDYCMAFGYDEALFRMSRGESPDELDRGTYFLISHDCSLEPDDQPGVDAYKATFFYNDFHHMLRAIHNPREQWLRLTAEELRTLRAALQMVNTALDNLERDNAAPSIANKALYIQRELIKRVKYHNISDPASVFYMNRSKFVIYAMQGNAICEGYSKAYGFLLAVAGIQSIPVSGNVVMPPGSDGSGAHAWNMVKLEGPGEWYHVDATWNDTNDLDGSTEYFMLTDEQLRTKGRGRKWGVSHPVPPSAVKPFTP